MAEHGEIVTGATGLGAFLGALFGAWKLLKPGTQPEKGDDMDSWRREIDQAIADHAARLERVEIDRTEQRADLSLVFAKLEDLSESNARIEGALGIQRGQRK